MKYILDVYSLNAMHGVEFVYRSAAMVSMAPGAHAMLKVNGEGTESCCAALEAGIKKFCHVVRLLHLENK